MPLTGDQLVERFNAKKPPTALLFGTEVLSVDVETKTVRMSFQPDDRVINPRGTIQGGIVTAMLDDCAAYAGIVAMGEPGFIASLELKTSFFAPAKAGVPLYAEGRCLKLGKRIAFMEADLFDEEGTLLARLTTSAIPIELDGPSKLVDRT